MFLNFGVLRTSGEQKIIGVTISSPRVIISSIEQFAFKTMVDIPTFSKGLNLVSRF